MDFFEIVKQDALEKEAKIKKDRLEEAIEWMKEKKHWFYNVNTKEYILYCGSLFQEIDIYEMITLLKEQFNKDVESIREDTEEYCECHIKCFCNNVFIVRFKE